MILSRAKDRADCIHYRFRDGWLGHHLCFDSTDNRLTIYCHSVDGWHRHHAQASMERLWFRSVSIRTASPVSTRVSRSSDITTMLPEIIGAAVLIAPLTALFLFAGKSLAAVGAQRGWAFPWIAVSA